MKKIVLFVLVMLVFSGAVSGQDAFIIGLSIRLVVLEIGNPVPPGYTKIDRERYTLNLEIGTGTIILTTNGSDDIVTEGSIGAIFDTTHDASFYLSKFYAYFEAEKWQYEKINGRDTYMNENIIAIIIPPYRRIDGKIAVGIIFRENP